MEAPCLHIVFIKLSEANSYSVLCEKPKGHKGGHAAKFCDGSSGQVDDITWSEARIEKGSKVTVTCNYSFRKPREEKRC